MFALPSFLIHGEGCSVTNRIKQIKQPRGGYLNPKMFTSESLGEGIDELNTIESIVPSLVGLTVDYLSRYMTGTDINKVFVIAKAGADIIGESALAHKLISGIHGLDDKSIQYAAQLAGFDVCYRVSPMQYKPVENICPDDCTINNIRIMVKRAQKFFNDYGPKILDGFTFEGGYTNIVNSGDGDFLTKDTLWDFKVSRLPIKKEHTLQILMYWRMGLHSIHPEFKSIDKLGIYNPRMNVISYINIEDIPNDIIKIVDHDIIGYN